MLPDLGLSVGQENQLLRCHTCGQNWLIWIFPIKALIGWIHCSFCFFHFHDNECPSPVSNSLDLICLQHRIQLWNLPPQSWDGGTRPWRVCHFLLLGVQSQSRPGFLCLWAGPAHDRVDTAETQFQLTVFPLQGRKQKSDSVLAKTVDFHPNRSFLKSLFMFPSRNEWRKMSCCGCAWHGWSPTSKCVPGMAKLLISVSWGFWM